MAVDVTRVDRVKVADIPAWVTRGISVVRVNGAPLAGKTFAQIMRTIKAPREHGEPIELSFSGVVVEEENAVEEENEVEEGESQSESLAEELGSEPPPTAALPPTARVVSVDSAWSVVDCDQSDSSEWDRLSDSESPTAVSGH